MQKLLITYFIVLAATISTFAGTQFIITTNLDKDKMPVDNLSEIPFLKDHEYILYLYNDDDKAFDVNKVYFEINVYNESQDKYLLETVYTTNTEKDWGFCYKGIYFNVPLKLKIRAYTDKEELETRYINVVQ